MTDPTPTARIKPTELRLAQELLVYLYKERSYDFERYGQAMSAPPTIEEAINILTPNAEKGEKE